MPKKKSKSADSVKRQFKALAKKRPATPTPDTKATTAKSESMTYSRVTNSVIDRIRSMVSETANNPLTKPLTSPKKKRVVPAKSTKKPSKDASMPVPPPAPTSAETHQGDTVPHHVNTTDSVIERIRSMVSEPVNTSATPTPVTQATSPKKKRVAPANASKKQSADTSTHKSTSSPSPADTRVTDVMMHTYGEIANLVSDRIRRIVGESVHVPTKPANARKKKRAAPANSTKKPSANATIQRHPLPSVPAETGAVVPQPTVDSVPPHTSQSTNPPPDSYEIPFDMDAYLREKEDTPKLHLNRVQERTASPSSRGWVLVHMSHGEFPQKKLKCGLQLFWQVPHDIGKMYLGDHVFLCQSEGVKAGIIGHGYVADLPMLWGDVHRSRIVHNVKKPNTHTHVIGVRVVSAHKRIEYPVMRSMPLVSTINIPTMHIPYRQPLTTEQTFALLELWYM